MPAPPSMSQLKRILDELAEALVLAEPGEEATSTTIAGHLEALSSRVPEGEGSLRQALDAALAAIEIVEYGTDEESSRALSTLLEIVSRIEVLLETYEGELVGSGDDADGESSDAEDSPLDAAEASDAPVGDDEPSAPEVEASDDDPDEIEDPADETGDDAEDATDDSDGEGGDEAADADDSEGESSAGGGAAAPVVDRDAILAQLLGDDDEDDELLAEFITEATEHLDEATNHLLALERTPDDADLINGLFRAFHTIKGGGRLIGLDEVVTVAHDAESLLDKVRSGETVLGEEEVEVSLAAIDTLRKLLGRIPEGGMGGGAAMAAPASPAPVVEPEPEPEPEPIDEVEDADDGEDPGSEERYDDLDDDLGLADGAAGTSELAMEELDDQPHPDDDGADEQQLKVEPGEVVKPSDLGFHVKDTMRVDAERLDRLLEIIGETTIIASMVADTARVGAIDAGKLELQVRQLEKTTRDLHELSTTLRMIPIKGTFQKMARLVRDQAKKARKPIEFVTRGSETELDKLMVDRLGAPLMHLLRNAVDHGIEGDQASRVRRGKSAEGRIELRAFHQGGSIYIQVEDDGRGIDPDDIVAKAKERGLIDKHATLRPQEVFDLLFMPGFSTASRVTVVSGRGVGLDVVKREVQDLRGHVEVSSKPGQGTVFTIKLPLTLAIIDGMVISVGDERYVVHTLAIKALLNPTGADIKTVPNRGSFISYQESLVPLFKLRELFDVAGEARPIEEGLVVVVEVDGHHAGFLADEVLGQKQIVIKPLGSRLRQIPALAGGAVLGDGSIGIVLDVRGLLALSRSVQSGAA